LNPGVQEVPGSIPSQGPCHSKDVIIGHDISKANIIIQSKSTASS